MWRMTWRFYVGMLVAALFTNAVAVYLLHDVDPDRIGQWNLAYRELAEEFLLFAFVVAALFLLLYLAGKSPAAITTRFGKFQLGPISWYCSDTDPISGGIHGEADNRAFCRHVPDDLRATEPALLCCNHFSA